MDLGECVYLEEASDAPVLGTFVPGTEQPTVSLQTRGIAPALPGADQKYRA